MKAVASAMQLPPANVPAVPPPFFYDPTMQIYPSMAGTPQGQSPLAKTKYPHMERQLANLQAIDMSVEESSILAFDGQNHLT